MNDYAKEYDLQVTNGNKITDKEIRRACQLDIIERKKAKLKNYPYYYDLGVANKYVNLAKLLSPQKLASFQLAFISLINGWRLKSNPKVRRYQEALLTCARKNAKSYLASLVLCSELLLGEIKNKTNNQLYICAVNKKQASLTLNQAKDMIKRIQLKSDIARDFRITKTMIYSVKTGSRIEALSSRAGTLNGLNPTIVDVDEVEAMKDDRLIQVIKSAMALQPNGLTLLTSSAGFIFNSPVRTEWKAVESALKKNDLNSRLFGFIYTQDNRKEIFNNPDSWVKSNPLMDVPKVKQVMKPYLKNQLHTATVMNTVNATVTKNFNMFGNANNHGFINPDKWKATTVKPINQMNRSHVSIGVDLSAVHDITGITWTFPISHGRYYTDTYAIVPNPGHNIIAKSKADGINYKAVEDAGFCTISKSSYGVIHSKDVANFINHLINKYHWKDVYISFDPWHFEDLTDMFNDNVTLIKLRQISKNLSPVISWLYLLIYDHKILHENNILFNYGFHNVLLKETYNGNYMIDKSKYREKIDCIAALLDSLFVQKNLRQMKPKVSASKVIEDKHFTF